jgi:hypothetical protein
MLQVKECRKKLNRTLSEGKPKSGTRYLVKERKNPVGFSKDRKLGLAYLPPYNSGAGLGGKSQPSG